MDDELDIPEEILVPSPPAPVRGELAPSPYNFEFTGEDALRLTVHNSVAGVVVAVHYRMRDRANRLIANAATLIPTSDRAATVTEFPIGEGYLLNVTAFASSGAPQRGQTFVRLQVIRGRGAAAVVLGTIVQGYVTRSQDRAWPGSPIEGSTDGDGVMRALFGTNPAAGVEVLETVPAGARWELISMALGLATSGTVANRRPELYASYSGQILWSSVAPGTIPASSINRFYWAQGMPLETVFVVDACTAGLPARAQLPAGAELRTNTFNLDAADNYQTPSYVVREWLEVL